MASKPVRPWLPAQPTLLPTDLRRWLPETHLVWFVLELVDRLDLRGCGDAGRGGRTAQTSPSDRLRSRVPAGRDDPMQSGASFMYPGPILADGLLANGLATFGR